MPRTVYLGGKKALHHEPWDMDLLSFFELEALCTKYGYTQGDLMYYAHPAKSLDEDVDVLEMVSCHKGHNTIILYLVGFGDEAAQQQQQRKRLKLPVVKKGATDKGDKGKGKEVAEDYEEPAESPPADSFWDQVVSGEEDVFEDRGRTKLEKEPKNSQDLVSPSEEEDEEGMCSKKFNARNFGV
ncbi:hypothetical protein CJ030_MR0G006221 [Morella rubra]|uniref:PB1-like domain-containing protein n=1 Tax=Morella rubra TaxID=262757 RepID=A0A6A1UKP4_9ROSI|nr:hypothetical protein CJ030_MR0G006221 [Morella rubra]